MANLTNSLIVCLIFKKNYKKINLNFVFSFFAISFAKNTVTTNKKRQRLMFII